MFPSIFVRSFFAWYLFLDSEMYAHFVFRAFDHEDEKHMNFEVKP